MDEEHERRRNLLEFKEGAVERTKGWTDTGNRDHVVHGKRRNIVSIKSLRRRRTKTDRPGIRKSQPFHGRGSNIGSRSSRCTRGFGRRRVLPLKQ